MIRKLKNVQVKKLLATAVCCAAVLAGVAGFAFAYGKYGTVQAELAPHFKIFYNNEATVFKDTTGKEVIPIVIGGTTYLPLRGVCETAGVRVEWVAADNTILLEKINEGFEMIVDMITFDSALNTYIVSGVRAQAVGVFDSGATDYDYYEDVNVWLRPDQTVHNIDGEFVTMDKLYKASYAIERSNFDIYPIVYYARDDYISFSINE